MIKKIINKIKKGLEKWAIYTLYLKDNGGTFRINKKTKKITFYFCGFNLFMAFASNKERRAMYVLLKLGYKAYENMWFLPKIKHTKGEIIDIIEMGRMHPLYTIMKPQTRIPFN